MKLIGPESDNVEDRRGNYAYEKKSVLTAVMEELSNLTRQIGSRHMDTMKVLTRSKTEENDLNNNRQP